jgi:hypothetical protein
MGRVLAEGEAKKGAMGLASTVFLGTEETSKTAAIEWIEKVHKISKAEATHLVHKVS